MPRDAFVFGTQFNELGARDAFALGIQLNDTVSTDSVSITSPTQYRLFQRDGSDEADIPINGTYVGTPTAIEASFNGGAYATIDASPSAGTFSGTLTGQAAGQGTLTVRFTNNAAISNTVADIGIGDLFLILGDSIAEGAGTNNQTHGHATFKAVNYRSDDVWRELTDPTSVAGTGSHWPLLARHIMEDQGVPVGMIGLAAGSNDITGTNDEWVQLGTAYASAKAEFLFLTQTVKSCLVHLGPNAAVDGTTPTQAAYNAALDEWISDLRTDFQADLKIVLALFGQVTTGSPPDRRLGIDNVRKAVVQAWGDNANVLAGPVLVDQDYADGGGDGVHPKTNVELQQVADRWWAALDDLYYGGTAGRGPQVTAVNIYVGYAKLVVIFDQSLKTGLTFGTGAWIVEDTLGAIAVSSIAYHSIYPNQIVLTLASEPVGATTVTYASSNDAAGVVVPLGPNFTLPAAAGTINLPAEPCYDVAATVASSGGGGVFRSSVIGAA